MSKTKKLPKYVTYQTLAQFAKAADATFAIRLNAMEERLRAEFAESSGLYAPAMTDEECAAIVAQHPVFGPASRGEVTSIGIEATYEGNHLAPTPAEGEE